MRRTIFDEDHEAFRDTCRTFVDRVLRPDQEKHIADHGFGRDVWLELGRLDLLGLNVPEEYGGVGVDDPRFTMVLSEELSKLSFAYPSCVGIHADCVAPYLVELGTEEQKRRWLPRFCTGELVTAIGMTEPSGGSDLAALRTTAVRDGDGWVLNGSKTFITNGWSADLVLVAARTSPEKGARGITLFAVETGMPGFERGRKLDKVGQQESDTAELFFADVRLGPEQVVGEVDGGFVAMMERLVTERIGAAVYNLSHARQILDETLVYVRERQAFGQPIGSFQANRFTLAELVTTAEVTQAFVDACVMEQLHGRLTAVDAAKAKWWTAQVQNDILDACVQLWGGYGYMNEYRVTRAWADARVSRIWAGSNEIMKELIGRDLGLGGQPVKVRAH
ncbi:acyl-CoA dehydrogenase family protein [Microlunatus capsulatus]|uniref:Alkylation response protein AidB-like acyl-CoA dehydrogenase n=1 Tax=Microlunatus capsulatus TaxID=99117 RepID=A0ABS4Z5D0_9ACTN|nr:acyl-CoA dehydrogenase family protein [Microlunatus capsulatus]MBP2416243.1 alkylation response protein AidB-like acyl-CoA dehydrogenase [Microlunatus capsulatus]